MKNFQYSQSSELNCMTLKIDNSLNRCLSEKDQTRVVFLFSIWKMEIFYYCFYIREEDLRIYTIWHLKFDKFSTFKDRKTTIYFLLLLICQGYNCESDKLLLNVQWPPVSYIIKNFTRLKLTVSSLMGYTPIDYPVQ